MEQVLDVYEQPYNPLKPVICFDERPCQLLGNVFQPIAMKPGRIEREDYHYKRNGTCAVLMAVEPLAGHRIVKVTELKTMLEIRGIDTLTGTKVHGWDDHRIVMALAIAGIRAEGETVIDTADSIDVSFPNFCEVMKELGVDIKNE